LVGAISLTGCSLILKKHVNVDGFFFQGGGGVLPGFSDAEELVDVGVRQKDGLLRLALRLAVDAGFAPEAVAVESKVGDGPPPTLTGSTARELDSVSVEPGCY
jgi:hypothetical protein